MCIILKILRAGHIRMSERTKLQRAAISLCGKQHLLPWRMGASDLSAHQRRSEAALSKPCWERKGTFNGAGTTKSIYGKKIK